jgi:hypothetical protein
MNQPGFFDREQGQKREFDYQQLVLFALGEFQSRGKLLAERELALDRLRGALRRAAEWFGVDEIDDQIAVDYLNSLGVRIRRVPTFVAKHPYRIFVPTNLAEQALQFYSDLSARH